MLLLPLLPGLLLQHLSLPIINHVSLPTLVVSLSEIPYSSPRQRRSHTVPRPPELADLSSPNTCPTSSLCLVNLRDVFNILPLTLFFFGSPPSIVVFLIRFCTTNSHVTSCPRDCDFFLIFLIITQPTNGRTLISLYSFWRGNPSIRL